MYNKIKFTEEHKRKISITLKEFYKRNPLTEKHLEKLKKQGFQKGHTFTKGKHIWENKKHPMLGKKLSEETKEKIRKSREKYKGKNHPFFGKHHTEKAKRKISLIHRKGRYVNSHGYILIYQPNHPFSDKDKNILEHRIIMEQYIGRYLKSNEVVHHINEIKNDNRIKNLMLFKNSCEHLKYHNSLYKRKKRNL